MRRSVTTHARRFGAVFTACLLAGCHVQFVSDYDGAFDQEVTETQKDVSALMVKIESNVSPADPGKTAESYQADKDAYRKIHVDFDTLLIRAKSHAHNDQTIRSVMDVQNSFAVVENAQSRGGVSLEAVRTQQQIMDDSFTVLMKQELLKKSGSSDTAK